MRRTTRALTGAAFAATLALTGCGNGADDDVLDRPGGGTEQTQAPGGDGGLDEGTGGGTDGGGIGGGTDGGLDTDTDTDTDD